MMRGDCLVRTPVRPWSPTRMVCDDKEAHNDSGISPGRSSVGALSTSPPSPGRPRGSLDSDEQFQSQYAHSPAGVPFHHSPTGSTGPFQHSPPGSNGHFQPSPTGSLGQFHHSPYQHSPPGSAAPYQHSPGAPSPNDSNGPYQSSSRSPQDGLYHHKNCAPSASIQANGQHSPQNFDAKLSPNNTTNGHSQVKYSPKSTENGNSQNGYSTYPPSPNSNSGGMGEGSLERLKLALERSSALAGIYKQEDNKEVEPEARKEFPCPLCAYTTPYRHRYMEHVSTHYSDKCTLCEFKGQNVIELRSHLAEVHGVTGGDLADLADPTDQLDQPSDGQDDEENPRRNKSKIFRCKQCAFVTSTKVDFWEHTKTHIKAEKLLTCPKCPFVTEYKHHLEYHLRNHFGSKPFKCNKCSYSCVNKSMLNSHLKSHSNVYQYRCADCAYATKYCHSLKLHLRKYDHSPAMVLNQDGSPNPLPIIDVYGTRRGPKQKKQQEEADKNSLPGGVTVPPPPQTLDNDNRPKFMACNLCEFYTASLEQLNQHMYAHAAESPFAQMFRTNNNLPDPSAIKDYLQNMFLSMEPPASPLSLISPHHSPQICQPASPLDLSKAETENKDEQRPRDERKNRRKGKAYKLERPTLMEIQANDAPADLSHQQGKESLAVSSQPQMKTEIVDVQKGSETFNQQNYSSQFDSPPSPPSPPRHINPYDIVETKLEEPQNFKIKIPPRVKIVEESEEPSKIADEKIDAEGYTCSFCDMAFKDVVMYTMHMGYHGFKNPFTCNMCGQETSNRVAFFLHIARQPHT